MFLELLKYLVKIDSGFTVISYYTLRAVLASFTALLCTLIFGNYFISKLKKYQIGQVIRTDGPESHIKDKQGTPTMGGILILFSFVISLIIWGNWRNNYLWIMIITAISFASIGFIDDFLKIKHANSKGLKSWYKYLAQSVVAIVIISLIYFSYYYGNNDLIFILPFFKEVNLPMTATLFFIIAYFVIVGSSNAVNLTDGLDGLAIMPIILIAGTLAIFAYVVGNVSIANYLQFPYIKYSEELVIVCSALAGAGLGFLWFNTYPAQIFMGDVGSLFLGGVIGTIAIIIRQELVFFIISGVFVVEALSVILQVGSYKLRKKRIFLMAPIHHHFEKKGLKEPKIIVRFWITTILLIFIGISSLKIR